MWVFNGIRLVLLWYFYYGLINDFWNMKLLLFVRWCLWDYDGDIYVVRIWGRKIKGIFFCLDEIFYCFIGKENKIKGFIVKIYV